MVDARDNPDNPKQRYGIVKPSMQYVSPIANVWMAEAMREGAEKYGPFNWRTKAVEALTYYSAAIRHLDLWMSGEDIDPVSGVHHLGHAMACMNILLDAQHIPGCLIDNRPKDGGVLAKLVELRTKVNTERQRQRDQEAERAAVAEAFKPPEPMRDPPPVDLDQMRRDLEQHKQTVAADVDRALEDIANG